MITTSIRFLIHEGSQMKQQFRLYLQNRNYRPATTIPAYINSIEKICAEENLSWMGIAENIHKLVKDYDSSGVKAELGEYGHRTVINALKRFQEFIQDTKK